MTKNMVAHSKNNGTLLATTEKVADILEREMDFVIHALYVVHLAAVGREVRRR